MKRHVRECVCEECMVVPMEMAQACAPFGQGWREGPVWAKYAETPPPAEYAVAEVPPPPEYPEEVTRG